MHGNDHSDQIMHCLVKVNVATQLRQKWSMILRRITHRNLEGVYDGMLRDLELKDLLNVFRHESCADVLIRIFCSTCGAPENIDTDTRFTLETMLEINVYDNFKRENREAKLTQCGLP
jgi:hypothetical protein